MYEQSQAGNGNTLYRGISALGSALGIAAAILFTPVVFEWSRNFIFAYLAGYCGRDIAALLTWAIGAIEGFIIYSLVHLLFTFLVICMMAAFTARRFAGR